MIPASDDVAVVTSELNHSWTTAKEMTACPNANDFAENLQQRTAHDEEPKDEA